MTVAAVGRLDSGRTESSVLVADRLLLLLLLPLPSAVSVISMSLLATTGSNVRHARTHLAIPCRSPRKRMLREVLQALLLAVLRLRFPGGRQSRHPKNPR